MIWRQKLQDLQQRLENDKSAADQKTLFSAPKIIKESSAHAASLDCYRGRRGRSVAPISSRRRSRQHELPRPDHIVVVIFENHSFEQIISSGRAPFIDSLAANGALFVNAFAVAHPSQPNYFALFSGSTQGVHDNNKHSFAAPNLATALDAANKSFVGYVETGSPRNIILGNLSTMRER